LARFASVGIDIGGSKSLFVLLDPALKPIQAIKIKTRCENERDFTKSITAPVQTLLKQAHRDGFEVSAIGIGCAGTVDPAKNTVKVSPNIPALQGYSFTAALARLTHSPIRVYNDVNAGLYGELKYGAAVGYEHVIAIFLGTGVGAAVAIHGKVYAGASNVAGDIGRFLIHPFGLLTGHARFGVLDNFASRPSIAGEAAVLAAKHRAPNLLELSEGDVRHIKSGMLAEAIRRGDQSIEDLVKSRAHLLGIALANVIDFLNPQMLILGGGLTHAMPALIRKEIAAAIKAHASPEATRPLRVVVAKLKGHAIAVGAAKLALDET
jgi:glucokinase